MSLYEIHITLDRDMEGVDQGFSTEPKELREMIDLIKDSREKFLKGENIKINKKCIGSGTKKTLDCEQYVRNFAYKSIFTIKDIKKGEKLTNKNMKCLRPGEYVSGLEPLYFDLIEEHFFAKTDIKSFEPITWDNITK